MKKKMLLIAGLMMTAVSFTFAQVDTSSTSGSDQKAVTPTQTPTQTPTNPSQNPTITTPGTSENGQNYAKDMAKIQAGDLPANLRQTLQSSQYKGWEKGNIYRSKTNDGYVVETTMNGQTQAHRFGNDGKLMKDNKDN